MLAGLQTYPSASFFSLLPERLQNLLIAASKRSQFEDGELIHPRGDKGQSLSIIESGHVRFSTLGRDGTRVSTITLGAGESFGEFTLFAGTPRLFDMHAIGPTVINAVVRQRFEKLLEDEPEFSKFIIQLLARRLLFALEILDDERRLPLVAKLAKTLLRRPRTSADNLNIAVTQKELANELSVSRVALGTAINKLKLLNLISTSYGQVTINDLAAFRSWVQEQSQLAALVPER
ncbi:MAG: cyclic nucleotide-binding domain-containing protein [Gammaproteobacteria bacterium]|jgi:CRP-like cAMP-binding protein|nr:cyclic nucleotide-binding domain-containing protein [Gammaproteobacteria bacterium]